LNTKGDEGDGDVGLEEDLLFDNGVINAGEEDFEDWNGISGDVCFEDEDEDVDNATTCSCEFNEDDDADADCGAFPCSIKCTTNRLRLESCSRIGRSSDCFNISAIGMVQGSERGKNHLSGEWIYMKDIN
jgi:hypothetical protein